MPTIQEPESFSNVDEPNVDESLDGEKNGGEDTGSASRNATADRKGHSSVRGRRSGLAVGFTKHSLMTQVREVSPGSLLFEPLARSHGALYDRLRTLKPFPLSKRQYSPILSLQSYDVDLMEPHTIIQVTPATPSSTDSSKTSATASNMLENLLDELQTFSKQSSINSPSSGAAVLPHQRTPGSLRLLNSAKQPILVNQTDTIVRKGDDDFPSSSRVNSVDCSSEKDGSAVSPVPEGIANEHIRAQSSPELFQSAL